MAESNKIFCEPCENDGLSVEASVWCTDCCEGFCEECVKGHRLTKILRNHHIITIPDHLETEDLNVSQTCAQHSKPLDSFCPQHDELLCLKCIQLNHGTCSDLLRIDEAVKGVKTSTALVDIEKQITTLLRNIARSLGLNTEHKKNIGDQKESIKSTINATRAKINTKLDQLQEKLLNDLDTKYDKIVIDMDEFKDHLLESEKRVRGLQTQLNGLKMHASDRKTFIGMKNVGTSVYSVENEFNINRKYIHADLQLRVDSSITLLTDELKEFGEIVLQNECDYTAFIEPQSGKAQLDIVQVFDITKVTLERRHTVNLHGSEKSLLIRGCVMLNNKQTVFTDFLNKKLIIHDQTGEYKKEIKVPQGPKYITVLDEDEVAVSYPQTTSYVDIINLTTNRTVKKLSCNSENWHYSVCFHGGKLFIVVIGEGVKEFTRDGILIKSFLSQVKDIGIIGLYDNHFYYSKAGGRTLYCTDLDGNPIWEFTDKRLVRGSYATPFAVDGSGNVYVLCYNSNIVLGISFDRKNQKVLLDRSDGLNKPSAIYYNRQTNQLLVCNEENGKALIFDLKH